MTTSLNGRTSDRVPLTEITLEDPGARHDRAIMANLAELEATLDRLQAELDAVARKHREPRWYDPFELLRWAAFVWLMAYGVLVLVGVANGW